MKELRPMRLIKLVAMALLAWPAAEIVAFILVAATMGFAKALFLILLMSFAGLLVLRHFSSDAARFRVAGANGVAAATLARPEMAPSVGGLLLLIPGFVTSVLGIMILLPLSRRWLLAGCRRLLAAGQRQAQPEIVDLAPDEWQSLPSPKLPSSGDPPRK
ncbi:MAG TPA: FxsA family protein [Xanthobacteraceae bacterium]|nr:FxsA family protein [Xanthobacteraceae bacterium]